MGVRHSSFCSRHQFEKAHQYLQQFYLQLPLPNAPDSSGSNQTGSLPKNVTSEASSVLKGANQEDIIYPVK